MVRRASLAGAIGLVAAVVGAAVLLASTRAFTRSWPVLQPRDVAGLAADFCGALGLCARGAIARPSLLIRHGPRDSAKIALTSDMGGRVVLMHLAGYNTAAALPPIIDGLRARGFELVTVSDLSGAS